MIVSTGCCGIAALNMLSKDSHINAGVEDEHKDADDDLVPPREAGGVDDGHDVVRYEAAAVAGPSGLLQEVVFPLRERTIPAEPLDQHTPHRRRQMNPHQLRPPQHEKSAEDDEEDEGQVDGGGDGGGEVVEHARLHVGSKATRIPSAPLSL